MANRYWRGGAGTWDTSSTTNWSDTPGGAGGFSVPTAADNVFFDQAGTYTVTMTGALLCLDITVSAGTVTFATGTAPTLAVSGSMNLSAGTVWNSTGATTFNATTTGKTVTTNAVTLNGAITFNGVGGGWSLGSALTSGATLAILAGSFSTSTSNYAITCTQLDSSTTTSTRTISLNGSTVTLSLAGAAITLNSTNLTFDAGTSQITLTGAGTVLTPVTISAIGGVTFYNVSYTGLGYLTFSTIATYNNFTFTNPATITLTATQTINGTLSSTGGSVTSRGTITSDLPNTTQRILSAASVSLTDVNFASINADGAAIPFTGTRLGNLGNNADITFTAGTKYWSLAAGGSWNSVAWATSSGGTPDVNNYPLPQDSCIIENTGLNTSATITMVNATFTTIDMSTRTNAMTLSIPQGTVINVLGNWINGSGLVGVGSVVNSTGGIYFSNNSGGTSNITSAGKSWSPYIYVQGNVTVSLVDALVQNTASFASALNIIEGSINLNGFDWTCSTFVSQGSNSTIRSISFGSNFINLTSITVGAVNLNIGNSSNFTATGAGGFKANMSITRQFSVSVANGTSPSPPNLFINAGNQVPTFLVESCFTTLDFTGSTCTPAAGTVDVYNLVLAAAGTYTNLTVKTIGTGTITPNAKTLVSLTCSSGTTTLSGTLTAPTTVDGGTLVNPTSAVLNTSTLTLTTGTVNLNGGTLPTTAAFAHNGGTLNVNSATSLTATSTYTFTAGTITLTANLTTGIFSSNNSNTRSIAFGSSNIILATTTALQTVLNMATATGFTYTSSGTFGSGTGGFQSTMSVTRTFTFGTTGGSATNAPRLQLASGASIATLTTGSWFGELDFGTTGFILVATSLNLNSLYSLNSTSVLTALTSTMVGTGSLRTNTSIGPVTINSTAGTTSLITGSTTTTCTTCTLTSGTLDINSQTLTCSSTFTFVGGSLSNIGTINCTTFTVNGATFAFASGTITPSVSFVVSAGAFTYSGTAVLSAVPTFTVSGGAATFSKAYALSATGTFTISGGSLTLGANLTTGAFASSGTVTRSIAFSTFNIVLAHTTAATVVLSMADLTNFTWSGTGGFTADMTTLTRSFTCGSTTGGSITTAPNLAITAGASIPTFTTGSWFNNLNFTGSTATPAVSTVNVTGNLTLAAGGTYTNLSITAAGTGTITNNAKTIAGFTVNNGAGTVTLSAALSVTSFTQTAGTINFATFNLTCSATASYVSGTFNNQGTITCTTFTNSGTFAFSSGTITPSVAFGTTAGTFTYSGTAVLSAVPTFTQTAGNVTLNKAYALTATGTYTIAGGTLTLGGVDLTTGAFASSGTVTRSIAFGTNNIVLSHTTAATVVLSMADLTNFTWSGTGGFTANGSITRSFTCGSTTGGSITTAPNLAITAGAAIPTFTTGSWFNNLDFTGSTATPAAGVVNVTGNLILAVGGTYTNLSITAAGTGTITNNGKTIAGFIVNNGVGTVTLSAALSVTTFTQTAGTINFATFNLTCSSTATYVSGTFNNQGTITCTTFTVSGTFAHSSGTITPSVSFVTTAAYTQSGTSVLSTVPTFTQTAGNVTFRSTYSLTATGTYTIVAGTLTLGGNLTTGAFASSGTVTRSIAFSTFNIVLAHTTAATTVLSMADLTNFTWSGTGGFTTAMSVTRTLTCGSTAGGSITTAPNLTFTSGASIPTFTTNSWFKDLNFSTTTFDIGGAPTINVAGNLTLSASGGAPITLIYTATFNMVGTGLATLNGRRPTAIAINTAGTITSVAAMQVNTAFTITAGTMDFANFAVTITSGTFTWSGGTFTNMTSITADIFTLNGPTYAFSSGTITTPTVNITGNGSLTFSGTASLPSVSTINQTLGNVTFGKSATLTNVVYTLTAGTLTLGNFTLQIARFLATGTSTRTLDFGTSSLMELAGNNVTIWDGGSTGLTILGTMQVTSLYTGATGTRTINASALAEANTFDIKIGAAVGISLSGSATDTVSISGAVKTIDMTGMACIFSPGTPTVYGNYTIPATGGTVSASANVTTFASTNATARTITISRAIDYPMSFSGIGGTFNLGGTLTTGSTRTVTLTGGTLTLNGFSLSTGIFASTGTSARAIAFGSTSITLSSTVAATTVLSMADATGFTWTGTSGFTTTLTVAKTFVFGTTAGSSINAPNLALASGAAIPTFTTNSWFNTLDFTGTTSTPAATTVFVSTLTLATGGTYTSFTPIFIRTQTWTTQFSKQLGGIGFNLAGGTLTLGDSPSLVATGTTTLTAGTLALGGFDLTTGIFSSTGTGTRAISFGSNNIVLAHTTAATTVLAMDTATNFTYTGTGGFTTSAAVTKTIVFGTTGGSAANAPNLTFTTGASVATLTTASWFKNLNFGTTTFNPGTTTLNIVGNLTLSSGGTYSTLTTTILGTGTINSNTNATLGALTINSTSGTTTLSGTFSLAATGTTTLTSGTLALNGFTLTTGTFSSSNTNTRSIAFGSNNIVLAHTTAATTVLVMDTATNFTWTGTGGFTAGLSVTRTFTFGSTAGGSTTTAPNLSLTSGAAVPTITTNSWFNTLDFTGTTSTPAATTVFVSTLTLATGGTYTSFTPIFIRTQTWTTQFSKQLGGIGFNLTGGTLTLGDSPSLVATGTTTLTAGTLALGGFDLTTGIFSSSNTNTRAISFGSNNIVLAHTTAAQTVLSMADTTNFTYTGTGGFTASAAVTRTCVFGTTGGSTTNAPNLSLTGAGVAIITLTSGSWFDSLNFGTTAFALAATTLNISGTITLSASGTFTSLSLNMVDTGGILSNGKTILAFNINNVSGTTTLSDALSLVATGTTTLTSGGLSLNGFNLTTGSFVSSSAVARSIAFGANNIVLAHTTLGTTVLSMSDLTNFTWSGAGGFTSGMAVTRTFSVGNASGATASTVPNLSLTSGASIPTISTGSVFKNLTFTGSTSAPASTNISVYGDLTLASGGSYTTLTVNMIGAAGNVNSGGSTSLLGLVINNSGGTTTLTSAVTLTSTGTTTLTSGNLNLGGFTLTTGTFSSSNTNTRAIAFGATNIVLAHATLGTTVLAMDTVTNFTYTTSGTFGSGTGCFQSTMSVTRTFTFGTSAGASTANAPTLYLASGASIPTLTSGGWFKEVNFGTSSFTIAATTLNLINIYNNSSTCVLTLLTANMVGTGTIVMVTSIGPLIMNTASITTTVQSSSTSRCTTLAVTQGSLVLGAASSLICSSTATWNSGSLDITSGTLQCTTFTLNGPTLTLTAGTLTPTTSFVLNTGLFTYGGTATLGATPTFTQNAGTVTFNKTYAQATTGTYSLVAGNLILAAQVILSTGIFSSSGASTRTIGFGASVSSGSAVFNGTSQYASLTTATSGPLDLASGAGNWTVECWFNMDSTVGTRNLFSKGGSTGTVNPSYTFSIASGTGQWVVGDGAGGGAVQNLSTSFVANTWYHFALVRDGSQLTAFVNGVADSGGSITMGFVMSNTANALFGVGNTVDGANNFFAGKISNLRIVKGVAVYTGNFTVPVIPLTSTQSSGTNISAITGTQTSLLLNTVSTSFLTDSSTNAFVLTSVGSVVSSFSSPFSGLINLTHTTAATVVLSMADLTNFSYTGSGGFTVAAMNNTRTFTYGTSANGSSTTAVNLEFTTGASAAAITNGSWFKTLNFGTTTSTATGTGLNVFENLYLNGTYTAVTLSMLGTGYISGGVSTSLLGLTINTTGTITMAGNMTLLSTGTTTLTQGSFVLSGYTLTTGIFSSNGTGFSRSVNFGTTKIILNHTTAATTALSMADVTGFTWTGTTGGFSSSMNVTRTFNYGTAANGSLSTAVNLLINGGASIPTISSGGWFKNLDFTGSACVPAATTLNIAGDVTLASGGTFTAMALTMLSTSTITPVGKTVGAFVVNTPNTITLVAAFGSTTYTQTTGTMDFAGFNMTCSSTATYDGGTLSNIGTLTCTTFTKNTALSLSSGAINPSVSFVQAAGAFTLSSTATVTTALFTHSVGVVTFNNNQSMTVTGTYNLASGNLILADGVTLNTGIFTSNNTATRSIAFGSTTAGNINLTHTTAATVVLSMADLTGFSDSGPGGFTVAAMNNTRTFTYGTTGGTTSNAANLTFTTGASIATITSGSWFNNLNFGTTTFNPGTTTLNIANSLTLSATGAYLTLTPVPQANVTYTFNSASFGPLAINASGFTVTLGSAASCTTFTMTAGTLNFASFNLTCSSTAAFNGGTLSNGGILACTTFTNNGTLSLSSVAINPTVSFVQASGSFTIGSTATIGSTPLFTHTAGTVTLNTTQSISTTGTYTFTAGTLTLADGVTLNTGIFSSSNVNVRAIVFGSTTAGNINLTHTTAATTVLSMADLTNFSYTGSGGFTVADMNNTRTFAVGSTSGGSTTTAPNLTFTTGASVATFSPTTPSWFKNLNFGTTSFAVPSSPFNIAGNLTLSSSGTYTGLTATMVGTGTVTTNAKTIVALTIGSATLTGTATLAGDLTLSGALTLTQGSLACSTYAVQSATFASTGALTRSITGSGTYTITGAGATAFSNASTGITITGLIISMTAATAKTFAGGGGSFSTLNQGGAGALTISGNNSFGDLTATTRPSTITFTASSTQTFAAFTLAGTVGNLITINSSIAATRATLSKSSGTVSVGFLSIQDSNATGGAGWYAGTTSTNVSNNLGWIFTAPPVGGAYAGNFFAFF